MSQFKTLKKTDPDFKKYLWGQFSETQVALPITTLNLGSVDETVTFEIFSKEKIIKPKLFVLFLNLIKVQNFVLILVPWFYIAIKNIVDGRYKDPTSFYFASIAMLFMFGALNIRNDIHDHISGYDRVNKSPRLKPLSLGWVTAADAKFVSNVMLFIASLLAIPVMIAQPEEIRVIAVVLLLMFFGRLLSANSYKNQRWGEVIFFILIGPGVVSGYQVALGSGIDTECLVFGVMWAWAIQFLVHINNFSHILTSSQAGIKNAMTNAGFDKAKKIIAAWWIMLVPLWVLYHFYYASTLWLWMSTSLLVFWSIPTIIKISEIQSPVGSDLVLMRRVGHKNFLIMSALIIAEFVWYFLTQNGGLF